MKVNATVTTTKVKVTELHKVSVPNAMRSIEEMLDIYCAEDYDKFLRLLPKLKKLVDTCVEGHGVGIKRDTC